MQRQPLIKRVAALIFAMMFGAHLNPVHASELNVPQDRSEKIRWAFAELNINTMELLPEFYHDDARFVDPVVNVTGLEDIRKHYEYQYAKVREISFAFVDEHVAGDTHTIEWEMTLRTKRLNKGKTFTVPGSSVITFRDDKVVYHRDYFDLGDMLYERVPVMRFFTKKIKKRLHFDHKVDDDE